MVAERRRGLLAALDGPIDVRDDWLHSRNAVSLIEESARAPDHDQADRFARCLALAGVREVFGTATEYLDGTDESYVLAPDVVDLDAFARERSGMNYALMPTAGLDWLLLCTVNDFVLIAGSSEFVLNYAQNAHAIARDFETFAAGDAQWNHPTQKRLLRHATRW